MIIYKATNNENGKSYIGQTILSLESRIKEHIKRSRIPKYKFHKALNKFGSERFTWNILKSCNSMDELTKNEQYFIDKYYSMHPNGYNVAPAGDSVRHSKKTKEKLAQLIIGKSYIERFGAERTKDILIRKSKSMIGKNTYPRSEEVKKKISKTRINKGIAKGKKNPNYGKHFTPEQRKKMSEIHKGLQAKEKHPLWGKHHSEKTKEKIRNAHLGMKASEETKLKMSISRKKYLEKIR